MKRMMFLPLMSFLLFFSCSDEESGVDEVISKPNKPTGPGVVFRGEPSTFSSGGAVSSKGHTIEYRFDLDADGAHDFSAWSSSNSVSKGWSSAVSKMLKAQARCSKHIDNVSPWSDGTTVTIIAPITTPSTPTGPASALTDQSVTFCSGDAVSIEGDPLEYRFDFDAEGVRDTTDWNDGTCVLHSWPDPGTYLVRAQARSATNHQRLSSWSSGLEVSVNNPVILLDADFNDKGIDQPLGTGGALLGEPVQISSAITAIVRDEPLSTPCLELQDNDDFMAGSAIFEFLGGEEVLGGVVIIDVDFLAPSADSYSLLSVREQGSATRTFTNIYLTSDNWIRCTDAGGDRGRIYSYSTGNLTHLRVVFYIDDGTYEIWINRVLRGQFDHGITDRGVGWVLFGLMNDTNLTGRLYVDNILVAKSM